MSGQPFLDLLRWEPRDVDTLQEHYEEQASEARMQGLIADLHLAQEKIKTVAVYDRDFSSMTLTMDPKDMSKAKKLIREFRRNFVRVMEKGSKKSVHQISIQFFPITSTEEPVQEPL